MSDREPAPEGAERTRTAAFSPAPWGWWRRHLGRVVPDDVWTNWCWDVAAGICSGIFQGAVWTFALQIARGNLRATGTQMALATAAPAIGFLFATLWARQMEGRSKLPFVTVTWLISRGLFLLTPLLVRGAVSREMLVGLICITPIIFSVSIPAYTFIMQDIYPAHLRGRLMSYVRIASAGSMLVTAGAMGALQEKGLYGYHLDYRWMFAIGGLFGAGSAWAFQQIRLPAPHTTAPLPPVGQFIRDTFAVLIHNRGYRWFTASVFVGGFGNLIANTYYPIYQVDHFHITPLEIAGMQNVAGILMLFSLFFWGWYMDRFGSLAAVMVSYLVLLITPLSYAFGPTIGWLYVGAAAGGIASSGIDIGYLNTTLMFAEPGRAAHYEAVHSSFFGLRGTIAPLIAIRLLLLVSHTTKLHEANWRLGFLIGLTILTSGAACQIFSMRSYRLAAYQERAGE